MQKSSFKKGQVAKAVYWKNTIFWAWNKIKKALYFEIEFVYHVLLIRLTTVHIFIFLI